MTAQVANIKQGLTRIPTDAELIKENERENTKQIKTNEIREVFDRNAWWYFHESPLDAANKTNNIHPADLQHKD